MKDKTLSFMGFVPGRPLPRWYRVVAWILSHFYYSAITFVNKNGQKIPALDGSTPTLLLVSHRNGGSDGWVVSQLLPHAQFLASVQLLRSRFLRLLFTGIPVVRDKDRQRYGFTRSQAGNPILHAIAHLTQGGSLAVFPEGTSEWSFKPQPYQAGAAKIIRRLLQDNADFQVIVAGSFYQCPDRFGSFVELLVSEPLALPLQNSTSNAEWDDAIQQCVAQALNAVSVNCADEQSFIHAEREAALCYQNDESYALAFKRAEAGTPSTLTELKAKTQSWYYPLVYAAFVMTLLPILGVAWWAGRYADGRNSVTFFRLAAGFAVAWVWIPCLILLACIYPWLLALYLLAVVGWKLHGSEIRKTI